MGRSTPPATWAKGRSFQPFSAAAATAAAAFRSRPMKSTLRNRCIERRNGSLPGCMAWSAAAYQPAKGEPPRPMRRGCVLALLLLALAPTVSGCETLERMDYLDRIFDPSLRVPRVATAMEPVRNPVDPPAATDWDPQP